MKVLMIAGSMHVGGLENQLMHLLRNADKKEFQIDFTSNKPDAFFRKEIEELGGKFIVFSANSRKHPIKYCREMYRIMKRGKYDIVHSHELFHSGINLLVAKMAGVPCRFVHAHSWCEGNETGGNYSFFRKIYHNIMKFLIRHCSTMQIACSTWAGDFLYGEKIMKKPSFHLIYNSVDTSQFLDNYMRVETGEYCETEEWKNVIYVARICALKNHIFLVEIAKELKKRNRKIRFLLVGDGDEDVKVDIVNRIEKYQLEEYVRLLGVRNDVDVLLRKSSAFIMPSKYEGMPLVMIEAQATGLPCVTADTYSKEVDFEIGMVKWLPLSDGVEVWANTVELTVNTAKVPRDKVEKAIEAKGFDSKIFTKKMCELYRKDYELRTCKII